MCARVLVKSTLVVGVCENEAVACISLLSPMVAETWIIKSVLAFIAIQGTCKCTTTCTKSWIKCDHTFASLVHVVV